MAQQQQQPTAGAAAGPPTSTESVIAKPSYFDGDLANYFSWRHSLSLYMAFNSAKFPNEGTKVACALTYMTSGSANNWAQAYFKEHLDATGDFVAGTWADFIAGLDATFKDPNLQKKVVESLLREKADVDKEGPEAFFANYEVKARNAGIPTNSAANNAVHINNLDRLMPYNLRERIRYMPAQPTTYTTYKAAALLFYPAYKEKRDQQVAFKAGQKTKAVTPSTSRSTNTAARTQNNPRPRLTEEERERRRKENLCFICRSVDHQIWSCPLNNRETKPKVRITVADVPANEMTAQERTELRTRIDDLEQPTTGF